MRDLTCGLPNNQRARRQDINPNGAPFPLPKLIRNEFGGSVGGAVILPSFGLNGRKIYDGHNRTFFFVSREQVYLRQGLTYSFAVRNTGNTTRLIYGPERGYHLHFGVYDADGFGVVAGAYTKVYGNYKVPYGYTYNPLDFLGAH